MSRETPNRQFAAGSTKTQGFLSGLERGELDMALAAIQEVLAILREWDREESEKDIERD